MKRRALCGAILLGVLAAAPSAWAGTDAERGKALYAAGDYEPAKQIFESILAAQAADETALYYLGKIRLDHSDLDGAREYFEKLVEVRPDDSTYQLALGEAYGEKARTSGFFMSKKKWAGKWKERLELAFVLDPRNLDAREWLVGYLVNAPGIGGGDKDRGTRIARETIEIDEVVGHMILGYAYRRSDKFDFAIPEYLAVLSVDPEYGRAYSGLGHCYLGQEEYEKAEASFAKAIEVSPDDAVVYEAMAYYWSEHGSKEAEAQAQESALQLSPLLSDIRYDLAKNYEDLDLTVEAMDHYDKLIALTPKHHKAGSAKKRLKKLKNPRRSR